MPSSNLTSKPAWIDTYNSEISYGFDASGLWFSGDNEGAFPVRTNLNIATDVAATITFTFIYNENCSDHGVCVFMQDNEPQWSWGPDTSRISIQYDCGTPELLGQNDGASSLYELTVGNTYTCVFTYDPATGVSAALYEGTEATGTPVDLLTLNEVLPEGVYNIALSADQDDTDYRSYFTSLTIETNEPVITRVFRAIHLPHRRREEIGRAHV